MDNLRVLKVDDYADEIRLYDQFLLEKISDIDRNQLLNSLLLGLGEESSLKLAYSEKRKLLYGKLNALHPRSLNQNSITLLDNLLQIELSEKSIFDGENLYDISISTVGQTKVAVWQGDIATLKIDAIVNAANNQLLGCFQPQHKCIDNVIHSGAGVRLREDCYTIMQKQGFVEPTGLAKITRAYNLPSKFILHTVGPIVHGGVTQEHQLALASSYTHCLDLSKETGRVKSIAFCCISTGVFGYPQEAAAEVAYQSVTNWLKKNPGFIDTVIFNVFLDRDRDIYYRLNNK